MAVSAAYATHAMPEVDAIHAASALHGAVMNRKDHHIALAKRYHFGSRLHAWPLLRDDEFAAAEVFLRF